MSQRLMTWSSDAGAGAGAARRPARQGRPGRALEEPATDEPAVRCSTGDADAAGAGLDDPADDDPAVDDDGTGPGRRGARAALSPSAGSRPARSWKARNSNTTRKQAAEARTVGRLGTRRGRACLGPGRDLRGRVAQAGIGHQARPSCSYPSSPGRRGGRSGLAAAAAPGGDRVRGRVRGAGAGDRRLRGLRNAGRGAARARDHELRTSGVGCACGRRSRAAPARSAGRLPIAGSCPERSW